MVFNYSSNENDQDSIQWKTKRATSPELEAVLGKAFPVLDHGFVRVVDYMGDDAAVVQAARVSYGKGTKKKSADQGLINYLMRHRHTTPFEMCEIKFHVKLPIFVARQWIRHRTASVNEYSARYSILDREFYTPTEDNLAAQSTINKQGREELLQGAEAERALYLLKRDAEQSYQTYEELLNCREDGEIINENNKGLARELARMNLNLSYYTQWYWKTNLHNLMHFLSLRADSHAQYEIRVYADVMVDILKKWMPLSYEAFVEHRMNGGYFSATALRVIQKMLKGEEVDAISMGLSAREWQEVQSKLGLS
ncbi:MAG: thymidylate synthase (FAD) [Rickettsiales bacterium]|nr:thymidylate synthase (FAD) [Rickettsiales bacterium]|tara:strand:+ start:393 stop:1322 length:930 start_codon:yes stop_codon:yes gene_type:complete